MKTLRFIPMLASTDLEKSIAFYRDEFGFVVVNEFRQEGRLIWCKAMAGESEVMFQCHPSQAVKNGGTVFYVYTDDISALRERLIAKGHRVGEIGEEDGRKECDVRDLDGNELMLCEVVDRK